jgi:hypothetical protein
MNFQVVWSAIQPLLGQLLQSPQFKSLVDQIWSDLISKIASGVHPTVATQQAQGQVAAAALLHLTGNPVADFSALLAGIKPPPDLPPAPPNVVYKS